MEAQLKCRTLIELFDRSVSKVKLVGKNYLEIVRKDREEELTFGQLGEKAREFALYLIEKRNIWRGDKVAVLGKNRADWDVAFWGVVLVGAVPVLIDPERRIEGVRKHLLHTETKLLIIADDYQDQDKREKLKASLCRDGISVIEMTKHEKPSLDHVRSAMLTTKIKAEVNHGDTAVILCTSGTTGDPREVEISHTNLIANVQGALESVKITEADKLGHVIPPHHSFGLTVGKLIPLWVGATNLYTNQYRQISQLIKEKGITIFVGIPVLFAAIANRIEDRLNKGKEKNRLVGLMDRHFSKLVGKMIVKKQGWGNLRFFVSGAAPLPKWVLEVFWKRGLQLREGYGLTENSPVYGFNTNSKKLGSVGRPISTLLVKIINEKNEVLGPDEIGEIVLGGPCVVKGYHKNPKATNKVIKTDENGVRWLYTGDLGYLDEDGYLFITGRGKHLIVLPGGKNVNPELVELALSKAQYVEELVVVPGRKKGPAEIEEEAVKAIVRPDFKQIRADTKLCRRDLEKKPDMLKNLVWESINKYQQESQELASFEKVQSKNHLEIEIKEFRKTSTGKIKRNHYIEV